MCISIGDFQWKSAGTMNLHRKCGLQYFAPTANDDDNDHDNNNLVALIHRNYIHDSMIIIIIITIIVAITM